MVRVCGESVEAKVHTSRRYPDLLTISRSLRRMKERCLVGRIVMGNNFLLPVCSGTDGRRIIGLAAIRMGHGMGF